MIFCQGDLIPDIIIPIHFNSIKQNVVLINKSKKGRCLLLIQAMHHNSLFRLKRFLILTSPHILSRIKIGVTESVSLSYLDLIKLDVAWRAGSRLLLPVYLIGWWISCNKILQYLPALLVIICLISVQFHFYICEVAPQKAQFFQERSAGR